MRQSAYFEGILLDELEYRFERWAGPTKKVVGVVVIYDD